MAYVKQLVYLCLILVLFFSIIALVFGVFDETMSFLTLFGPKAWYPVNMCVANMKHVVFNIWTLLLLYTGFIVLIAGLPLYVKLPSHWIPYEVWRMIVEP